MAVIGAVFIVVLIAVMGMQTRIYNYCWVQRTEDVNALLMAFQLHGGLISPCDVTETSDGSKDSVIYCHAHSKSFNSRIS